MKSLKIKDAGRLGSGIGPRKTNMIEVGLRKIPSKRRIDLPFPEARQE